MKRVIHSLLAITVLAFAGPASAATFDIDGNGNILFIGALELNFDESSPQEDGLYNVEFVYDTGISQYSDPPTFDIIISEDTITIAAQIADAMTAEGGITGAGSNGDDIWYIPGIEFFDAIYGSASIKNYDVDTWDTCRAEGVFGAECLAGVSANQEDDVLTYARISIVPIPAAAWLFGSALGLLGWVRRRAT